MNHALRLLRHLAVSLLVPMLLGGCSILGLSPKSSAPSFQSSLPTVAQVSIVADSRLNQDSHGRATPVMIRVYLLKNLTTFSNADFFSLYEKDQQLLADTLVWREEIMLKPGEVKRLDPREVGEGRFVAILAAFRDIDHARWQTSVQLIPGSSNDVLVLARENEVTATQGSDSARLKTSVELPDASQIRKPTLPQMPQAPQAPQAPQVNVPEKPSLPSRPNLW